MNYFYNLWNKIKERVKSMFGPKEIEKAIRVAPTLSSKMADAITLWSNMYEDNPPWLKTPTRESPTRVVSLGLPSLIASEKARLATLEMESEITTPVKEVEKENPDYQPPSIDETTGQISMGVGETTIKEDVPIGNTDRAEFLNEQYKKLKKHIRRQLEYGIAKGGLVIKPYIMLDEDFNNSSERTESTQNASEKSKSINTTSSTKKIHFDNNLDAEAKNKYKAQIEFDFIQADNFYPLSFDANGKIVEAAFIQRRIDKEYIYSRLEYHKLSGKTVTVSNYAYRKNRTVNPSESDTRLEVDLGQEIALSAVPEWADLQPTVTIEGVDRLLFAYFKMPEANTVDPHSPLGVSAYSRVVNLIKDADYQYSRLLWEYEGGELAIDVDRDALKLVTDVNGNDVTNLPIMQERLFRKVDLNSEETYNVFAPELRDTAITNGLNTILMRIEDATGLSRGTISGDPQFVATEAKTATEMKILKQRSYSANADIQEALEDALKDVVYVMDVYATLYKVTAEGKYEISFEWDDSILVDAESELTKRLALINAGLASKLEVRMWYFGETENQAKAALQKIDEENKRAIETNMMAQSQLGQIAQEQSFKGLEKDPATKNAQLKQEGTAKQTANVIKSQK